MISIADKKFRGRDKIVQKMTKDGLVDENLRTGEQKSATAAEKLEQEDSAKETAEKETDPPIRAMTNTAISLTRSGMTRISLFPI